MDTEQPKDLQLEISVLHDMLTEMESMSAGDPSLPTLIAKARKINANIDAMIADEIRTSVLHLARLYAATGRNEHSSEIRDLIEDYEYHASEIVDAVRRVISE